MATKVSITLSNISHTYPADIDVLLVGPQGRSVVLMSDAGSTSSAPNPINNVTLTFEDNVGGSSALLHKSLREFTNPPISGRLTHGLLPRARTLPLRPH